MEKSNQLSDKQIGRILGISIPRDLVYYFFYCIGSFFLYRVLREISPFDPSDFTANFYGDKPIIAALPILFYLPRKLKEYELKDEYRVLPTEIKTVQFFVFKLVIRCTVIYYLAYSLSTFSRLYLFDLRRNGYSLERLQKLLDLCFLGEWMFVSIFILTITIFFYLKSAWKAIIGCYLLIYLWAAIYYNVLSFYRHLWSSSNFSFFFVESGLWYSFVTQPLFISYYIFWIYFFFRLSRKSILDFIWDPNPTD